MSPPDTNYGEEKAYSIPIAVDSPGGRRLSTDHVDLSADQVDLSTV
ncbi:MAG: hypothetical protein ACFCUU_16820 [Cyclobacteriaceae bacterium]